MLLAAMLINDPFARLPPLGRSFTIVRTKAFGVEWLVLYDTNT